MRGGRCGGGRGRQRRLVAELCCELPSGKHTKNYGKSPFSKSTINGNFNSYVKLPEGTATYP